MQILSEQHILSHFYYCMAKLMLDCWERCSLPAMVTVRRAVTPRLVTCWVKH